MPPLLLYSGGLDSLCIYHMLLGDKPGYPDCMYIDNDASTAKKEKEYIQKQTEYGLIPDVLRGPFALPYRRFTDKTGFVPLRNLLLAALPVMEGYDTIYLGAVKGEGSRDKSEAFLRDTSRLFSYCLGRPITVSAPYRHLTKAKLVEKALCRGLKPFELSKYTTSCYVAHELVDTIAGCGQCTACFRRFVAMEINDIHENYALSRKNMIDFWNRQYTWRNSRLLRTQPVSRWPELFRNNAEAFMLLRKLKK